MIPLACGGFQCSISMRVTAKQQRDIACMAASPTQNLQALAAITLQSLQCFAMMQGEHIFKLKKMAKQL